MKNRLAILTYHQVPESHDPLYAHTCHRSVFRKQLAALVRYFNVVSLGEGIDGMLSGSLPQRAVTITFDDGYRDNYDVAFDELRRAKLPATFFIATDYLDGGRMWNDTVIESIRRTERQSIDLSEFDLPTVTLGDDDERTAAIATIIPVFKYLDGDAREDAVTRLAELAGADLPDDLMMTSSQVQALHNGGMTIGAHTSSHPILLRLSPERARDDIKAGRDYLERLIGTKPRFFAYPNGKPGFDYNKTHVSMLEDLGFDAAFSTEWGFAERGINRFELPRVGFGNHTGWRFSLRLLRSYFEAPVNFAA